MLSATAVSRRPSALPKLPTIADLLKIYGVQASARLSQNFLLNPNVTRSILDRSRFAFGAASSLSQTLVVEVGPGPGILTRSLLEAGADCVVGVELDTRFAPILDQLHEASDGRFAPIYGNMLTHDHADIVRKACEMRGCTPQDFGQVHIVGNLPFGVSNRLMMDWLRMAETGSLPVTSMLLMFQKEVGDRIVAPPGKHPRSRYSVLAQLIFNIRQVCVVKGATFVPPPKVDASVIACVAIGVCM
ncbi:S-adenosyl-L-methionine-dependent methyltransferase [Ramicandelaber brevisporus]|nr:S-adenosyl-L-methionine-dependent methyltransferase [Ramicandelaber brevisporus]